MGVYLPNVNMPKDDKVVTIQICPDGSIWQQYRGTVPNAKAVPIPPHGRLGDLDAFESVKYELPNGQKAFNRGFHSGVQYMQRLIMDAPTIIEAEEGEA